MKLSYFGYGVEEHEHQEKTLCDLRSFFRNFAGLDNPEFRNGFTSQGEHLYLIHEVDDVYLFLTTRSTDIVKKINTNELSIDEIRTLLGQDEQMCFASYVLIKENFFGFASTIFAPKVSIFSDFVNDIFTTLGIHGLRFYYHPLLYQATKDEAKTFVHIGRTTIELDKQNGFASQMLGQLGMNQEDVMEIDGIEIVVKPRRKQNIKNAVDKLIDNLPDEGLEKFVMRAKSEAGTNITDLYLTGLGSIADIVNNRDPAKIPELLEQKVNQNTKLQEKLGEFVQDENFDEVDVAGLLHFDNVGSWPSSPDSN